MDIELGAICKLLVMNSAQNCVFLAAFFIISKHAKYKTCDYLFGRQPGRIASLEEHLNLEGWFYRRFRNRNHGHVKILDIFISKYTF